MDDPFIQRFLEIRIGGRYQIRKRLGSGSFGEVHLGRDVVDGRDVAIKLEHCSIEPSHLEVEVKLYNSLRARPGFPLVFWHGSEGDYRAMVFQLLGPTLEDLFRFCEQKFSLKTVLELMDQLLRRIESLHATGYLHRDFKPENFLLGTGKQGNTLFMTDLGLADEQTDSSRESTSQNSEPPRLGLVGTCYFASINSHLAVAGSRRDDLESLGYMALYFLRGSLPWRSILIKTTNRSVRYRLVYEYKKRVSVAQLCEGVPPEFVTYMNYVRKLGDQDKPDYRLLRGLFAGLFRKKGFKHDNIFDWTMREFERLKSS